MIERKTFHKTLTRLSVGTITINGNTIERVISLKFLWVYSISINRSDIWYETSQAQIIPHPHCLKYPACKALHSMWHISHFGSWVLWQRMPYGLICSHFYSNPVSVSVLCLVCRLIVFTYSVLYSRSN